MYICAPNKSSILSLLLYVSFDDIKKRLFSLFVILFSFLESMPTMNTEGADGLRESMKISIKRSAAHKNSNTKHIKLPDNLPSDVLEVVEEIKVAASRHNVADMGSRSFFNAYINGRLLR